MATKFITKGKGTSRRAIPINVSKLPVKVRSCQTFDHYLDKMSDDELWAYTFTWFDLDGYVEMMDDWDPDTKKDAIADLRRMFPDQDIPSAEHLDLVDDKDKIADEFDKAMSNLSTEQFKRYVQYNSDTNFMVYIMKMWDDDVKADALKDIRKFVSKR
ncbi:hypothetical protein GQ472_00645 [archaeon]|nr:hypothetical protein [archaeon]